MEGNRLGCLGDDAKGGCLPLGLGRVLEDLPVVPVVVVGDLKVPPVVETLSSLLGRRPSGEVDKPAADVGAGLVGALLAVDVVDVADAKVAHVPEHLLLRHPLAPVVLAVGVGDVEDHSALLLLLGSHAVVRVDLKTGKTCNSVVVRVVGSSETFVVRFECSENANGERRKK